MHDNPTPEDENDSKMDALFQNILYRWDCPSPGKLSDYQLSSLSPAAAEAVEEHLAICPLCRRELATFENFLALDDLTAAAEEGKPKRPPFFSPATQLSQPTAALRGEAAPTAPRRFLFDSEEGDPIELFLGKQGSAPHPRLHGQFILTEATEPWLQNGRVEIWQNGALVDTALLDEFGTFTFTLPEDASFTLRIIVRASVVLFGRFSL